MVKKGIKGIMCHAIHRYAKANNKYMKDKDPSTESSFLIYQDVSSLYGLAMSQELSVDGFKWRNDTFQEEFIQSYDENSDKLCILKVDVECLKDLKKVHSDLTILTRKN